MILVGDTVIADYTLDYDGKDDLFQRYFAIPSDVAAANARISSGVISSTELSKYQ